MKRYKRKIVGAVHDESRGQGIRSMFGQAVHRYRRRGVKDGNSPFEVFHEVKPRFSYEQAIYIVSEGMV